MPLFPQKPVAIKKQKQSAKSPQLKQKSSQQAQAKLAQINANYKAAIAQDQFDVAVQYAKSALKLLPSHPQITSDLAFAYLRLGQLQQAYDTYQQAIAAGVDTNMYDGMTEVSWHLGRLDDVKHYGRLALQSKLEPLKNQPARPIPPQPAPVLSTDKSRNIIAFSLFGENPRYCETAVLNVQVAATLLPQWTCRFYCDETVPLPVRQRLSHLGGQVVMVSEDIKSNISGLMWRFLVMDDPAVERFMCRDADSLISTREQYAVNEWVVSGQWFHVMRDYATHTELILAGMWGGCRGVFSNLPALMSDFIASGNYLGQRVVDQHFLREVIWPTIRQSLCHHDSVFDMQGSQPFPAHPVQFDFERYKNFHVGANIGEAKIIEPSSYAEGTWVEWALVDQQYKPVCIYQVPVKDGHIRINLPQPYADKLMANEWLLIIDGKIMGQVVASTH